MQTQLPNSTHCFVCGDSNPAGLGLVFSLVGDEVTVDWQPKPEHAGYLGVVHGGVISAVLDEAMGWAPSVAMKRFCTTVELNVQFRQPIQVGQVVRVTAQASETARRIWTAEGSIIDETGQVLVKATGRFIPMSVEQSQKVVEYLQFAENTLPASELLAESPACSG